MGFACLAWLHNHVHPHQTGDLVGLIFNKGSTVDHCGCKAVDIVSDLWYSACVPQKTPKS